MKPEAYAFVVRCVLNPAHRNDFVDLLNVHAAEALRTEPLTLRFDVAIDEQDAAIVYLYEMYASEAAFEAHFAAMQSRPQPWLAFFAEPPRRLCIGSIVRRTAVAS